MERQDISTLKEMGQAYQEQYAYYDSDGEEHEGQSLISVDGLGKILTYQDVYLVTIPMLILSCLLGRLLFNSRDELRFMIYTNCIIGAFLLWLTTKPNIYATILYWCGIISAHYASKKNYPIQQSNDSIF